MYANATEFHKREWVRPSPPEDHENLAVMELWLKKYEQIFPGTLLYSVAPTLSYHEKIEFTSRNVNFADRIFRKIEYFHADLSYRAIACEISEDDRRTIFRREIPGIIDRHRQSYVASYKSESLNAVDMFYHLLTNYAETHKLKLSEKRPGSDAETLSAEQFEEERLPHLNYGLLIKDAKLRSYLSDYFHSILARTAFPDDEKAKIQLMIPQAIDDVLFNQCIHGQVWNLDFMRRWAADDFTYQRSFFANGGSLQMLEELVHAGDDRLIRYIAENTDGIKIVLLERIIRQEKAIEQRLQEEHRQGELDREFRREAKRQLEKKAAEEKIAYAAREAAKRIEYLSVKRPLLLESQVVNALNNYGGNDGARARLALDVAVDTSAIDLRDPALRTLGTIIFSESNLASIATACGAEKALRQMKHLTGQPAHELRRQLHALYSTSDSVSTAINGWLQHKEQILLLAPLTRRPERTGGYANLLLASRKEIARLRSKIAHFSEEELEIFKEEREIASVLSQLLEVSVRSDTARTVLAEEIREILLGRSARKTPSAVITATQVAVTEQITIPSSWLEAMNGNFFPGISDRGENWVVIHSREYPNLSVTVKREQHVESFRAKFTQFQAECELQAHNFIQQRFLEEKCGFQLNGDHLEHPEFGIRVPLPAGGDSFEHALRDKAATPETLKQLALAHPLSEFNDRKGLQESMLESVVSSGIQLIRPDSSRSSFLLNDHAFSTMAIGQRGYLTPADLQVLQLILIKKNERDNTVPRAPSKRELKSRLMLDPDETLVVPDTNILIALNKTRGFYGESWIDLPEYVASLPKVRIVIPSSVADFELGGDIREYNDAGKPIGLQTVDYGFKDKNIKITELLRKASRAHLRQDGIIEMLHRSSSNLIILDCPGERELYQRIARLKQNSDPGCFITVLNEEIRRRSVGEKSFDTIASHLAMSNPLLFLTQDYSYLRDAPLTTAAGAPISHTTLFPFLDALIHVDRQAMHYEFGREGPVTMQRFFEELDKERKTPLRMAYSKRGISAAGEFGLSVRELFRKVVRERDL